jgi:hypothetical protein
MAVRSGYEAILTGRPAFDLADLQDDAVPDFF